ncbi:MAG: hypothetical protein FJ125_05725, partial [Deltaproteobacteria bacterium]|nr:hypothetical protein [Deltaproteobacteria bacterium]
ADFVKNDGGHLYLLADGRFQILDGWPAEQTHRIASVPIEGLPRRMYVHDDHAFVYSSLGGQAGGGWDPWRQGDGECSYGYDCDFTGDGMPLKVTVLDIADRSAPQLVRELVFSASYLNSRRIGRAVHTVVVSGPFMPIIETFPYALCDRRWNDPPTPQEIVAAFELLYEQNRQQIVQAAAQAVPQLTDTRHGEGGPQVERRPLIDCGQLWESGIMDGNSLVSVASQTIDGAGELSSSTIISRAGALYSSAGALYLAPRHYRHGMDGLWFADELAEAAEATTIHKLTLQNDPPSSAYAASGVVKGRVLNQFSLGEHEGHLRIATTTGHLPSPDVHSTVSVLRQEGEALLVTGQVDRLAPSEDIRAVRFLGERGYVVTFKKTDPLFVLDLGDVQAPRVAGELHIPGFSTYLHRLDDGHLMSIGYDAEEQGDFAYFQGIQLQIFDVRDMADPQLAHREVIGTRGSTSDAATNHMAFTYFRARQALALPIAICEGGAGGRFGDRLTFSGLLVYRATADEGFTLLGRVAHEEPDGQSASGRCSSWWTRSSSKVKRSVFLEDYVFSISDEKVKVNHLDRLEQELAEVDLLR